MWRLVRRDRARARRPRRAGRGCRRPRARPGATPSSAATSGSSGPSTEPVGRSSGSRRAVAPRALDERVDVAERRAGAVVGEPGGDHRGRRRGRAAGEAQAEVVDRLEDHRGLRRRPRAAARCSSSEWPVGSAPLGVGAPPVMRTNGSTFCGAKPADADRPADDLAHEVAGAGVGPEQHVAGGLAVGADRHRRGPLPGDRDGVQRVAVGAGAGDRLARRLEQLVPPLDGVLRRRAVEPDVHVHGAQRRAAAPRRRASTTATLGPPLPRSTARIQRSPTSGRQDAGRARPRASRRARGP